MEQEDDDADGWCEYRQKNISDSGHIRGRNIGIREEAGEKNKQPTNAISTILPPMERE